MNTIRFILYGSIVVYVVMATLAGVRLLNSVASMAPIYSEREAVLMAAPAVFHPVILIVMLAYLISCVDKD